MKRIMKVASVVLLVISIIFNGILIYYIHETEKPSPSIVKLGFSEYDVKVYCEKAEDVQSVKINFEKGTYKIGSAEIVNKDGLYLVSPEGTVNLSEKDADAFVINSKGKLLYQLEKPERDISENVFVTPSGKKYHKDIFCAGRTAFETDKQTAELFGRTSCSICA